MQPGREEGAQFKVIILGCNFYQSSVRFSFLLAKDVVCLEELSVG